ncbi:MATE family efflux transporter [Bradyrhizobium diazoefficiens]|uniref:MATE family efflux transporter n=1 Tax=Bradyrhizobium diazoefficiens TaxID=1355477 RepID=UPI00190DEDAC|nr:MATE family efflux transporter [Bradyrhizobium diazoefficiens]QQO34425.1 MATE family efflux transporter [Bradyrhizobium diazoefficiens]
MSAPKSLWKSFLRFLAPLMLSNALQSLFGTVSNVYLGQMIGVDALAAVSTFFPVFFFLFAFVALATPADILEQASRYARIMLLTMPLGFVFLLMTAMIRGVGDAVTPLLALALSTAIGLILTPMLIRGAFGLPALGITSPAWAAAISNAVTLIVLAVYLLRKKHALAPDVPLLRHLRLNRAVIGHILGVGLPSAVGMVVMAIAELVLLGLVNGFGSDATAAYGAVNQVMGYTQFTAMSISIAVSILGAQAIGGGDRARLDGIVRTGLAFNLVLTGGLVALIYLMPRAVLGIFITDSAVLDLAKGLLFVALWSSVPFGLATTFSGAMRAAGVALTPMLLSAVILSRTIGLEGVWAAYPIVFCAMFVLQMGYYLMVWRKRAIRRLI